MMLFRSLVLILFAVCGCLVAGVKPNATFAQDGGRAPEIGPVKVIKVFQLTASNVTISADGKRLAVIGNDVQDPDLKQIIRVFDLSTSKVVHDFKCSSSALPVMALSPDGKQLVLEQEFSIVVADATSGQIVGKLKRAKDSPVHPSRVEFSPDGKSIWTSCETFMVEFSSKTFTEVRSLGDVGRRISDFGILPKNRLLAVSYATAGVRLYKLDSGKAESSKAGTKSKPAKKAQGKKDAVIAADDVIVLEAGTEADPMQGGSVPGEPNRLVESVDGKWLLIARFDRAAELWDLTARKKVRDFSPVADRIETMAIFGDKAVMAPSKWILPNGTRDYSKEGIPLTIFDLKTGKALAHLKTKTPQSGPSFWRLALSADGKSLYVPVTDGSVEVFDVSQWSGNVDKK